MTARKLRTTPIGEPLGLEKALPYSAISPAAQVAAKERITTSSHFGELRPGETIERCFATIAEGGHGSRTSSFILAVGVPLPIIILLALFWHH